MFKKIENQFQVGEWVVYVPENVITRISGYVWDSGGDTTAVNSPSICAYELECGIVVQGIAIRKATTEEIKYYARKVYGDNR